MRDRWFHFAACIGQPINLFFPPDSNPGRRGPGPDNVEARALCARCPVRRPCLAEALLTGDHGIRGGTTLRERRSMKRVAKNQPNPKEAA